MVKTACSHPKIDDGDREPLQAHNNGVVSLNELYNCVTLCKMRREWDRKNVKIIFCVTERGAVILEHLFHVMRKDGARMRRGQAAKGGLENDLERMLKELESFME